MSISKIKRAPTAMWSWFIRLLFRKKIITSKMALFNKLRDLLDIVAPQ